MIAYPWWMERPGHPWRRAVDEVEERVAGEPGGALVAIIEEHIVEGLRADGLEVDMWESIIGERGGPKVLADIRVVRGARS